MEQCSFVQNGHSSHIHPYGSNWSQTYLQVRIVWFPQSSHKRNKDNKLELAISGITSFICQCYTFVSTTEQLQTFFITPSIKLPSYFPKILSPLFTIVFFYLLNNLMYLLNYS